MGLHFMSWVAVALVPHHLSFSSFDYVAFSLHGFVRLHPAPLVLAVAVVA